MNWPPTGSAWIYKVPLKAKATAMNYSLQLAKNTLLIYAMNCLFVFKPMLVCPTAQRMSLDTTSLKVTYV
jgi:hypothetical protein